MTKLIAATLALVISLTPVLAGAAQSDPERTRVLRRYVERLQIGSIVTVWTTDGKKLKAILMDVDQERIVVKPKTRVPEPSRALRLDAIEMVEAAPAGGLTVGRAVAIGIGAGAASFGAFLLIVAAALSD